MIAATALLLLALVPGVVSGAKLSPARAADGDFTFTVAYLNEVDSFNPFLGIEAESFEMWSLMYDSLTGYTMKDMQPEPALATKWTSSDDGLTWTFTMRDDVTWSDGQQLTSADVAYTYGRILDGGPERSTWGSYLKGVKSVDAPDDTTVVLHFSQPSSSMPLLPIPIIPEHIWKDVSEDQVKSYANEPTDGEPVVGSGPFELVQGTAGGSTYQFERNPSYWDGEPNIDTLIFRVFKSEDPAIQALIKGEVDFVEGISALQVKSLQGRDNIQAINGDSPGFDEIAFNAGSVDLKTGKPIGDPNPAVLDPKFRYALNFAIDRDQIISKAYQGGGQPGSTIIPPAYADYRWDPPADQAPTFDLDKAGQLLDDAGYRQGSDGFRTLPDGQPIGKLRLFSRSDSPTSKDTMEYFQEWLKQLGIDSTLRTVESNNLTKIILDGDFDVFQWGWYVEPDPTSMLSYMTCDQRGGWSDSWYCNEQYDALYTKQLREQDKTAREDEVKQMQQILYDDAPYLVTAYSSVGEAWRTDRVACMRPQPDPGGIYLMQYGVYNYVHMQQASQASACAGQKGVSQPTTSTDSGGLGTGTIVGGGVALVVLVVGGGVVMMRRRGTVGDRE